MFNKTILSLFVLVILITLYGCKKDKEIFQGNDHYITAFKLTRNNSNYIGYITDSTITVRVPENTSLEGATAELKLSEQASIYPHPANISNWNEELRFVVTSHNGNTKIYHYTIERVGKKTESSVVLNSQEEVDAFGELGITEIGGSLIIGSAKGTDSITSLAPLYQLKKIQYSLIVYPTYSAKELTGLDRLETIGDAIRVESINTLEKISFQKLSHAGSIYVKSTANIALDFPSLQEVQQSLTIESPLAGVSFPLLKTVKEQLYFYSGTNNATPISRITFPLLKEAGSLSFSFYINVTRVELPELYKTGDIYFMNFPKLYNLSAPKLQSAGLISIPENSVLTEVSFPALVTAGGFNITVKSVNALDLPQLQTVTGDLRLRNAAVDGIRSLTNLKSIQGELLLGELPKMNGLAIPASLTEIGRLSIVNRLVAAPDQIDIRGLHIKEINLQVAAPLLLIGEDVFNGTLIVNPQALTVFPTLQGFKEVDSIGFNGYISYINDLEIKGIRKINKSFWMPNNNVRTFSMPDLETVEGNFIINHFNQLTQAQLVFPKLKNIGGDFNVHINSLNVTSVLFEALEEVEGDLIITTGSTTRSLSDILFPVLSRIGRELRINTASGSNNALQNLDGFAQLLQVSSVTVTNQSALTSFEGLRNAFTAFNRQWTATGNGYNPSFEDLQSGKWMKENN